MKLKTKEEKLAYLVGFAEGMSKVLKEDFIGMTETEIRNYILTKACEKRDETEG